MKTLYKIALLFALLFSASNVFAQANERERGIELYKQGDYAQAVVVLEGVSRRKEAKNDAEMWNYLGLSYLEDKKLKDARSALEKAVKLKPQSADFRTNLGYAYLLSRKIERAQSEIDKALALDPKNVGAYYVRGTTYLWEGKPAESLADADKIISIDKNYTAGYVLKSDVLVALFGKSIGQSEPVRGDVEFLRKSIEPLEYCLKYCQNSPDLKALKSRLEAAAAFYEYFNRINNKSNNPNQASTASENKTPLKILTRPPVRYTDRGREAGVQGTITLGVIFAADGKVSHILVLKKLGYGLDEEAVKAARQVTFEPATEDGKPVSVVRMVSYTFTIY